MENTFACQKKNEGTSNLFLNGNMKYWAHMLSYQDKIET